ncbi:glycosyltransferase 87 family protein [Amycolatopsis magusensis]|uniref:Alpha-1,2-mannosyltransferase n=1 Tax=Amycolatopsis magusensis TaxID=882444 RepID=A0ABS4PN26_9PSEU|nr:glycosyltransferase 87 family protein [Amycolatopsis magusensis]MBP2180733.1 alpha-1,2-mannosyltransferase [Amycolatopsis magusensis]
MSTLRLRADVRWWPAAALAGAALAVGVAAWLLGWHLGADSAVYRAGALTMFKGEPLYVREHLTTLPPWVRLPFTYPPAAALLFSPLVLVPPGLVWGVIGALSVLGLAVVVKISRRSATWPVVAGLTVAAFALEPVWKTVFLGQINLILMALIMLDVLVISARGSRWGGVLVGVAAAVKLTPLIFIPHLWLTGRRADALRALGTFAALQALMFAVMPVDAVRYWTEAASDPERIGATHWIFNQSLNGMLGRATEVAPWGMPVALAIGALLAVPAVFLVVRYHRRGEPLAAVLVTAFTALLVSPVSWSHHWVWVVPLLVLLVAERRYWLAAATALPLVGCLIMLVPNGGTTEFGWGPVETVLGNAYVLATAVALVGLAARELRRPRDLE